LGKKNLEEDMKEASPGIGVVFTHRLHTQENLINHLNLKIEKLSRK